MWLSLDLNSNLTITRQIYFKIKEMILSGALSQGEKLPSTRTLADELHISRNTVLEVYNQLIAEGYLEGHHGSGTIVSPLIADQLKAFVRNDVNTISISNKASVNLIDFRSGVPDLSYFPRKEWGRLYHDICYDLPASSLRYISPAGVLELRNELSQYLYRTRGISCSPDHIMIVSGSTQGLALISKLLYQENKQVITEDPLHSGLLEVISMNGFPITSIPVDDKGIRTDLLKDEECTAFLYTTPSHQYPMGGILPLTRRIDLIQYAIKNDCYIIEDDYDSEFRFEDQPVNSLYELKPDKVIYLGSFSKILAPAIRLGFILLPDELVDSYKRLKQYSDVHTEVISQHVLAQFIHNGGLERHIWKMKKLYNRKREHLLQELTEHFNNDYDITGQAAGLHVVVHFHNVVFTEDLVKQIRATGVKIYPVANYSINHRAEHQNEIILGYAHLTFEEITSGIEILSGLLCF